MQLITLATCYSEGQVTNYRLQITIDKHSADITKLLKGMCDRNLLVAYGVGRGTKYKINEDYLHVSNAEVTSKVASMVTSTVTSKADGKQRFAVSDKLKKEIIAVCDNYISLDEIAKLLGKSLQYLKNKVIPQMLHENLLERQFPNVPRHPHQKYRAVKDSK